MPGMPSKVSRRDFLKYVSAGMGALAFRPFFQSQDPETPKSSGSMGFTPILFCAASAIVFTFRFCFIFLINDFLQI